MTDQPTGKAIFKKAILKLALITYLLPLPWSRMWSHAQCHWSWRFSTCDASSLPMVTILYWCLIHCLGLLSCQGHSFPKNKLKMIIVYLLVSHDFILYLKYIDQLELHLWVNLQCGIFLHVIVSVNTIIKCKKKRDKSYL